VVRDRLLPALERLVDDGDRLEPLDVRHPVPAGDDEAEREAVLWRQRLTVDLVREQHLVAERLGDGEAPLVRVLDLSLDAAVEAGEDDLRRVGREPRVLKDRPERCAGPLGRADRLA
jgi:hypothetical protein